MKAYQFQRGIEGLQRLLPRFTKTTPSLAFEEVSINLTQATMTSCCYSFPLKKGRHPFYTRLLETHFKTCSNFPFGAATTSPKEHSHLPRKSCDRKTNQLRNWVTSNVLFLTNKFIYFLIVITVQWYLSRLILILRQVERSKLTYIITPIFFLLTRDFIAVFAGWNQRDVVD